MTLLSVSTWATVIVKRTSSRGQRTGQAEGRSPENTDNCLHEFHYEDLGRARAMWGGGTHLPRDASGLHGYVCIVRGRGHWGSEQDALNQELCKASTIFTKWGRMSMFRCWLSQWGCSLKLLSPLKATSHMWLPQTESFSNGKETYWFQRLEEKQKQISINILSLVICWNHDVNPWVWLKDRMCTKKHTRRLSHHQVKATNRDS